MDYFFKTKSQAIATFSVLSSLPGDLLGLLLASLGRLRATSASPSTSVDDILSMEEDEVNIDNIILLWHGVTVFALLKIVGLVW